MILLLPVVALLALSSSGAGAQTCLTKSQARAAWPNDYIQYRVRGGQRCWFATGKAHVVPSLPVPSPVPKEPDPEPLPTWVMQPPIPPDRSIWYPQERGPPPEIAYTTFDGAEPEVWPRATEEEPASEVANSIMSWALIGAGMGAVFAFGMAAAGIVDVLSADEVDHMTEDTPLMRQARRAAARSKTWSQAKQDYAKRVSREQLMALKYFCDICDAEGAGRASFTFSGQMQFNRDLCRKHFEELAALIKAWESAPKAHGMSDMRLKASLTRVEEYLNSDDATKVTHISFTPGKLSDVTIDGPIDIQKIIRIAIEAAEDNT